LLRGLPEMRRLDDQDAFTAALLAL
jgi:hypothetical protein